MRKHLLFVCLVVVINLSSKAQIAKGSTYLGGSIAYSSGKTEQGYFGGGSSIQKVNNFTFSPAFGKAIKDNLIFGIELLYTNGKQDYDGNTTNNSHSKSQRIGGGPFIRKYFSLGKNFYAFGQSTLAYQHIDDHQSSYNGTTTNSVYDAKGSEIHLALYPGLAYAVSRKFYLDVTLANLIAAAYQNVKTTYNNPSQGINYTNTNSFGISTGLSGSTQFSIGARFILGR